MTMRTPSTRYLQVAAGIVAFLFVLIGALAWPRSSDAGIARARNQPAASPTATPCPLSYDVAQTTGTIVSGTTFVSGTRCDDCSRTIPLPFAYTLYDRSFTSIDLSSNGVAAFGGFDSSFFN